MVGITALILAQHYRPLPSGYFTGAQGAPASLSRTAYDFVRIGGWALLVFGLLIAAMGLIQYAATQTRR